MDKLSFAYLMSYLGYKCQSGFDRNEVETINRIINEGLTPQKPDYVYNHSLIIDMLAAMKAGRKIDAIRAHRAMSGFGLKESKDFIEQHWIEQVPPKVTNENANLGDILRQVTGDK